MLNMDSSRAMNHSDFQESDVRVEIFNTQDREFFPVLEDLVDIDNPLHSQNKNIDDKMAREGRI